MAMQKRCQHACLLCELGTTCHIPCANQSLPPDILCLAVKSDSHDQQLQIDCAQAQVTLGRVLCPKRQIGCMATPPLVPRAAAFQYICSRKQAVASPVKLHDMADFAISGSSV